MGLEVVTNGESLDPLDFPMIATGITRPAHGLVVILQAQMRDQFLAFQMTQGVFQLHQLNE